MEQQFLIENLSDIMKKNVFFFGTDRLIKQLFSWKNERQSSIPTFDSNHQSARRYEHKQF